MRHHVAMRTGTMHACMKVHEGAWLRLPCIHTLTCCFTPAASIKGIPEFWSTVLLKCDTTAEMIKDKDLEVLNYLQDIQVRADCHNIPHKRLTPFNVTKPLVR